MKTTTVTTTVSDGAKPGSLLFLVRWVEGFEPSATGTTIRNLWGTKGNSLTGLCNSRVRQPAGTPFPARTGTESVQCIHL
jgi:hypothetical protein